MADSDSKMVLRTVYLPPDMDERLRVRAFRANVTKGDLIREGLKLVLHDDQPVASPTPPLATKVSDRDRAFYVANWLKLVGEVAAGTSRMTAAEQRKVVEAARKVLAAAKKVPVSTTAKGQQLVPKPDSARAEIPAAKPTAASKRAPGAAKVAPKAKHRTKPAQARAAATAGG